ncbi:MAG: ketopantoate reductase family protein [Vulcanimicrobiota bacterium]
MNILIIGSGAIGTFVGGVLTRAGNQVTFYDLPEVVEEIKTRGIIIEGLGNKITLKNPPAISDLANNAEFDLVIIAVKAYCTRAVVEILKPDMARYFLSVQNGIGNEEKIAAKVGGEKVIAGSITYPVAYPEPGYVKIENSKAGIGFAPFKKGIDISEVTSIFKEAKVNILYTENYQSLKWSKLLLNLVCNATCAILDMTPAEIFSDIRLVEIEKKQIVEAVDVMTALKLPVIDLPGYPTRLMAFVYKYFPTILLQLVLRNKIAKGRGNKKPSLLLALEKEASWTEVKYLNGAVYLNGYDHALTTRVNKIIYETLKDITKKNIPWEDYKKNPEAFLNLFY